VLDFFWETLLVNNYHNLSTGREAIDSLTHKYDHHSTWDANELKIFLDRAGFKNISEVNFMEGSDERLLKDGIERKWETLYMEG
jgi:hypothetical protein